MHVPDSPGPAAPAGTGPNRDGEPGAEPQPATVTAATATAQRDTGRIRRAWPLFDLMARGAYLAAPARGL